MNDTTGIFGEYARGNYLPPCVYCGKPATTIEHILPRSRGGTDDPTNLAPACKRCNSSKNDKTVCEWTLYRVQQFLRQLHPRPPKVKVPAVVVEKIRTSPEGLTFHQWIKTQVEFDDPIGDFARDWERDDGRPKSNRPEAVYGRLHAMQACAGAYQAFEAAWLKFCGETIVDPEIEPEEGWDLCAATFQPVPTCSNLIS